MFEGKLLKDFRREELFDQLCKSLEGDDSRSRMHVIIKKPGETDEEAKNRYCKETGRLIRKNELVIMVKMFSKSECSSPMKIDEDTTQESKPIDEVDKQSSYPPPGAFGKPEQPEQGHTPEKVHSPLEEKEERTTISIPSRDIPISGPDGWMV